MTQEVTVDDLPSSHVHYWNLLAGVIHYFCRNKVYENIKPLDNEALKIISRSK